MLPSQVNKLTLKKKLASPGLSAGTSCGSASTTERMSDSDIVPLLLISPLVS